MEMYTLGDIFQGKVDNILSDIEDINIYINDILVLIQDRFSYHIYQIRVFFSRLSSSRLNSMCLSEVLV